MVRQQEPLEPTDVYDSTDRTKTEQLKRAATSAVTTTASKAWDVTRSVGGSAKDVFDTKARPKAAEYSSKAAEALAPRKAVNWTESKVDALLESVNRGISNAVNEGKVDKVFGAARTGVEKTASTARKVVTRKQSENGPAHEGKLDDEVKTN